MITKKNKKIYSLLLEMDKWSQVSVTIFGVAVAVSAIIGTKGLLKIFLKKYLLIYLNNLNLIIMILNRKDLTI